VVRPIEFEEKEVLSSAMRCFWKRGYAATSMRDLEKATGLSTGSIYNSFGNKDGLFDRSLDFYVVTVIDRRIEKFLKTENPREGIVAFFADSMNKPAWARALGCLLVNTGVEGDMHPDHIQEKMKAAQKKVALALRAAIEKGQGSGEISTSETPRNLARHYGLILSGLLVRMRSDQTTAWHEETLQFIDSLMD